MISHIIIMAFSIVNLYVYFNRYEDFINYLEKFYSTEKEIPFVMITFFLAVNSLAIVIADGNLLILHIYLAKRGLTTYEYILEKRRKLLNVISTQPSKNTTNNTNNFISVISNELTSQTLFKSARETHELTMPYSNKVIPQIISEAGPTSKEEYYQHEFIDNTTYLGDKSNYSFS